MTSALERLLVHHVDRGTTPGAVATLGHDLTPVAVGSVAPGGPPIRADAVFRIQSMTKPIAAVAALRLVERGEIGLDDPVDGWVPELAHRQVLAHPEASLDDTVAATQPITLRHLLTCTSGYGIVVAPSPLQAAMDSVSDPSPDVVLIVLSRRMPWMPSARMRRSTVQRATSMPSRFNSAWT